MVGVKFIGSHPILTHSMSSCISRANSSTHNEYKCPSRTCLFIELHRYTHSSRSQHINTSDSIYLNDSKNPKLAELITLKLVHAKMSAPTWSTFWSLCFLLPCLMDHKFRWLFFKDQIVISERCCRWVKWGRVLVAPPRMYLFFHFTPNVLPPKH